MKSITSEKVGRLIFRVQRMLTALKRNNTLTVHQNISEAFYLEKEAELTLLKEQLDDAYKRLELVQDRVCRHYVLIYSAWRKDVRSLPRYVDNGHSK